MPPSTNMKILLRHSGKMNRCIETPLLVSMIWVLEQPELPLTGPAHGELVGRANLTPPRRRDPNAPGNMAGPCWATWPPA
jgi:hypothetical protein